MNLYWVTVCHMATRVMGVAQTRLEETVTKRELESIKRGVIVNHLYPLEECEKFIWQWAIDWKFEYRKPKVNLGGHGGQSFGIHALGEISDEDLVFVIDPDSYPRSKG